MAADFHAIEKTSEKKIKVGIVGEIYVKYAPFGNNDLEEFLFSQGCEYMVPGVLGLYYCASGKLIDWELWRQPVLEILGRVYGAHSKRPAK